MLFAEALKSGNIKINENGRIAFTPSGVEIPPAFGRGGMRVMYDLIFSTMASQAKVNTITFDDGYGTDGNVRVVKKDEDDRWIEVDVEEKRKQDDGKFQRNARRKVDATWQPDPASAAQPSTAPTGVAQHWPIPTLSNQPASGPASSASQTQPANTLMDLDPLPDATKPKYRLQSELGKTISVVDFGEKIMNAPIMLSIKEFLAVSPEMSGYIHEQTRRKRIPLD